MVEHHHVGSMAPGIICALVAAFLNAVTIILSSELLTVTSISMVGFSRQFFSLMFVLPYAAYKIAQSPTVLWTPRAGLISLRTLFSTLADAAIIVGLVLVGLTDSVVLGRTAPVWAGLLAWIIFRQHLEKRTWTGIAVSFAGVVLVFLPSTGIFQWASFIPLAAGLFAAGSHLTLRHASQNESPFTILFYYCVLSTILWALSLPWGWQTPRIAWEWILMVVMGGVAAAYQPFLYIAYKKARLSLVSALLYTSVFYPVIWDIIVHDRVPTLLKGIGIILVLAGGVLVVWRQHRAAKVATSGK